MRQETPAVTVLMLERALRAAKTAETLLDCSPTIGLDADAEAIAGSEARSLACLYVRQAYMALIGYGGTDEGIVGFLRDELAKPGVQK